MKSIPLQKRIKKSHFGNPIYLGNTYNLQCTTWAIGKLQEAGLDLTPALSPWGADMQLNVRKSIDVLHDLW
jgi:hypothetical protein